MGYNEKTSKLAPVSACGLWIEYPAGYNNNSLNDTAGHATKRWGKWFAIKIKNVKIRVARCDGILQLSRGKSSPRFRGVWFGSRRNLYFLFYVFERKGPILGKEQAPHVQSFYTETSFQHVGAVAEIKSTRSNIITLTHPRIGAKRINSNVCHLLLAFCVTLTHRHTKLSIKFLLYVLQTKKGSSGVCSDIRSP